MKLQGILIMRITDLIRFFDLNEFWRQRPEFRDIISGASSTFFFENDRQRLLAGRVIGLWLDGKLRPQGITLDAGRLTLYDNGFPTAFPLGRLAPCVEKARETLKPTDLIGLTALYLMLGANDDASGIMPDYDGFAAMQSGKLIGDFITISDDTEFAFAGYAPAPPFDLKYIANLNVPRGLTVKCGSTSATLEQGRCLTAIFAGEQCVAILPHKVSDATLRIEAELWANAHTRRADAVVHDASPQKRIIPGVTSLWLEPGHGLAYTSVDAPPVYPENATACRWRISDYTDSHPDRKILAVLSNEPQNYILYTSEHISH